MNQPHSGLEWTDSLNLGMPGTDAEHRRFFSLVEELDCAIARHKGPRDIERCLQVIVQEARAHFDHENRQFASVGYPHAGRHIAAHARLDSQLWDALRTCYATEPNDDWAKKGLLIKQMLLEHFQLDDSRYREFLRQRQV
jgi:hemerythrin-like metal-binding protein